MDEINQLTDAELRDELAVHMGEKNVPMVTDTTRKLMRRKLYRLRSGRDFVSVCSNDPADSESDGSDPDSSRHQAASPVSCDNSTASASAAAAAASSSPAAAEGRRFDSTPLHPGASTFGEGGAGSVFRETYRRRPLHEDGGSGGAGYYGAGSSAFPASPSGAHRPASANAAAATQPSRFRPSLVTCGLALALIGVAVFLLLHFDPLYENPVPELTQ